MRALRFARHAVRGVDTAPGGCFAQVVAVSISSNDFRSGVFIEVDGAPYRVLGMRGSAFARAAARPGSSHVTNPRAQSTCT